MAQTLSSSQLEEAQRIYQQLRFQFEKKYPGQYIAIDPISKEYFINPRLGAALQAASGRFPDRTFYTHKIGSENTITFS